MKLNIEKVIEAMESDKDKAKKCTIKLPFQGEDRHVHEIAENHLDRIIIDFFVKNIKGVKNLPGHLSNVYPPVLNVYSPLGNYFRIKYAGLTDGGFYVVGYDVIEGKFKGRNLVTHLKFTEKTDIPKLSGLIYQYKESLKEKK